MAKSKKEVIKETKSKLGSNLKNFLKDKEYAVDEEKPEFISTGNSMLNALLGGGIARRKYNMLVGRAGCGKTTLCSNIFGAFQKQFDGKCMTIFIDNESNCSLDRLKMCGFTEDPNTEYAVITASIEEVFKLMDDIGELKTPPAKNASKAEKDRYKKFKDYPVLIVLDSLANTQPEKLSITNDHTKILGLRAQILSALMPGYLKNQMKDFDITMIIINQFRQDIQMGFIPTPGNLKFLESGGKKIPGGRALEHNCHCILALHDSKEIKKEKEGFAGLKVRASAVKNRSFTPNIKTELTMRFVDGFNDFWTSFEHAYKDGIIKRKGAYYSFKDENKKEYSFTKKEGEINYANDLEFREAFDKYVTDVVVENFIQEANDAISIADPDEIKAAMDMTENEAFEESNDTDDSEPSEPTIEF